MQRSDAARLGGCSIRDDFKFRPTPGLLERCWHADARRRPLFSAIAPLLGSAVDEQGGGHGERRCVGARWRRVRPRVPVAEGVGHDQTRVREHGRLQPVAITIGANLVRMVRRNGDELDPPMIELGSQFLESPQLGDTVGSPVGPEKLDEQQVVVEFDRVEHLSELVN